MHLSAMGEVMNQMIGSSCTSLAQMFKKRIDISPPRPFIINYAKDGTDEVLGEDDKIVRVLFKLQIGDVLESEIMQILPYDFAKEMVDNLMDVYRSGSKVDESINIVEEKEPDDSRLVSSSAPNENVAPSGNLEKDEASKSAKKVRLPSFDEEKSNRETIKSSPIDLLLDVPLQVTVELGKTKKQIKDILNFNIGTIVELNKIAGDNVDIVINGKIVGRGEVVVIDDRMELE